VLVLVVLEIGIVLIVPSLTLLLVMNVSSVVLLDPKVLVAIATVVVNVVNVLPDVKVIGIVLGKFFFFFFVWLCVKNSD
jgi:hypothetical protein